MNSSSHGSNNACSGDSSSPPPRLLKEGWVQKRGEYIKNWRNRYMILYSNGIMYGYKDKPREGVEEEPLNEFNLAYCHVRISDKNRGFCFTVGLMQVSHYIERHLSAETAEERADWIEKINSIQFKTGQPNSHANSDTKEIQRAGDANQVRLDNFERLKVLGAGSFGKVLLVREKSSGDLLAMKVLKKAVIMKKNEVSHTLTEKRVLQSIQHPFLTQLKYAFQDTDRLFFVMEYVHGGELFYHLGREKRFPEDKTRFYTAEIVLGIEHLHLKNILYRDIKLENIMIDHAGHIKITDFGLCKHSIEQNGATTFCGTPEYLAPEVIAIQEESGDDDVVYGRAVDWWALGIVVFEMLFGRLPFYDVTQQDNRHVLYQKIREAPIRFPARVAASDAAKSFLSGLLEKDPRRRLGGSRNDAEDIKAHAFFEAIDWAALLAKEVSPPFIPSMDHDYFDSTFTSRPVDLTPPDKASVLRNDPFREF